MSSRCTNCKRGKFYFAFEHWLCAYCQRVHTGLVLNVGRCKLTPAQVREIKILLATGKSAYWLAKKYKVSNDTVQKIRSGKTWKHILIVEPEETDEFSKKILDVVDQRKTGSKPSSEPPRAEPCACRICTSWAAKQHSPSKK